MTRPKLGFWLRLAVMLVRPPMMMLTRHHWRGADHLPRTGGVVVCSNHISFFDPFPLAHFLYDNQRVPRFLAKASLFDVPLVGVLLRCTGQIPVYRDSADAVHALSAAVQAVRSGHCIALYPEGTITQDPTLWPMTGKTGAARIALMTGAPLVPVAQWGPHRVLPPGARVPRLLPRRTMYVVAGPPIDLTAYAEREIDAELLRTVTDVIMDSITDLLAQVRDEPAPSVRVKRAHGRRRSPHIFSTDAKKRRSA